MGLDLITYQEMDRKAPSFGAGGKITRQDLVNFCFDMEQMVRSGIPLLDGLRDMRDSMESPRFRDVLTVMTEDMEGGRVLSQCMMTHADVFDTVFVNLIGPASSPGSAADFSNLSEQLKGRTIHLQTRRLLIYPALRSWSCSACCSPCSCFWFPRSPSCSRPWDAHCPFRREPSCVSAFMASYWPVVLGLPIVAAVGLIAAVRSNSKIAYMWDYAKLRIPLLGPILQKIIMSRFANVFSLMYRSGITVLDGIKISEEVVGNRVISDGLNRAGQQVSAGEGLTETFQNLGMFPPLVIRMLRVGETTGALDAALTNVTYFYNRDVKEAVDKGLKMLGPVLTLVLGGMISFVIWAVLGPVYDILGKLKF